jgi:competence protein ComFC
MLAQARSALLFAGPVRHWIHELKYRGATALASLGGEPLESCYRAARSTWPEAAALVPVPLHAARRRERGFNQAELLVLELARRVGVPLVPVLTRSKSTAPQVGLAPAERRANVLGAFQLQEQLGAFCRGRSLLLVDDVLTTGSTLESAAGVLLQAGASSVYAITAARALPGRD